MHNKPHSEESKRKMSEKASLRIGEKNTFFGRKHSEEAKKKMRESKLNKPTRYWLGKKRDQETVEKVRAKLIGKTQTKETIDKIIASRKGYRHSKETREKISRANKVNPPNWQGGITSINQTIRHSMEYKLWRESVFTRDNWTCVWCGIRGGTLNADHIKPFAYFPELRFAIDNGRTLCLPCHKTTDTYAGKGLKRLTK